jgi:hypothetical protein
MPVFAAMLVRSDLVTPPAKDRRKRERDEETAQAIRAGSLPPGANHDACRLRLQHRLRGTVTVAVCLVVVWIAAAVLTACAAHATSHDAPAV